MLTVVNQNFNELPRIVTEAPTLSSPTCSTKSGGGDGSSSSSSCDNELRLTIADSPPSTTPSTTGDNTNLLIVRPNLENNDVNIIEDKVTNNLSNVYGHLPPHFQCRVCLKKEGDGSENEAKLLPCLHTVCSDCLTTLTNQHKFFLPCPVCKQHFPIPNSRKYPSNQLLSRYNSKMADPHYIDHGIEPSNSDNDSDNDVHRINNCPLHEHQPLEFYCQTCDYAVCVNCLKPPQLKLDSSEEYLSTDLSSTSSNAPHSTVSRHDGHSYTPLAAARKVERGKIVRLAQALQMRICEAEDAAEHLKIIEQNLNSRYEDSLSLLNKSFDKILDRLHQRKLELEKQLAGTVKAKKQLIETNQQAVSTCIETAKESADFLQNLLDSCPDSILEHTSELTCNNSNLDLLVVRKQLEHQTDIVIQPFPLNTVQFEETQLLFSFVDCTSEKLLRSVDNFGAIIAHGGLSDLPPFANSTNLLSPIDGGEDTKSLASLAAHSSSSSDLMLRSSQILQGPMPIDVTAKLPHNSSSGTMSATDRLRSWSTCIINTPQVVMLTAIDEHGQEAAMPANHDRALTVVIRDAVERVGQCDLKRVSGASFLLTYTLPKEGIYEMEICLFGMPVSSSPFVVRCYPVGTQLATPSPSTHSIASASVLASNNQHQNGANSHTTQSRYALSAKNSARPSTGTPLKQHGGPFQHHVESPSKTASSANKTSENATPRLSIASIKSLGSNRSLLPNKIPNSPMLRSKTVAPINRMRSKSTCGPKITTQIHQRDCPSHHINSGCAEHSHQVARLRSEAGSKTAELEQLRNFCKRVVMLTSGGTQQQQHCNDSASSAGDSVSDQRTAIPQSQIDDYLFSFGHKGRGKGEFSNIQDVCVTHDGRVVVSDSGNQNVQVFSSTGEFRFRFGNPGRNPGQLARPTGLAVSENDEKFYVADYENRCVHVYSEDGRHLGRLGVGKLLGPKGICLVPATSLMVVVDNRASEVSIYDVRTHKFVSKFGARGSQPDHLAGPHFACVLDNKFCSTNESSSRPRIAVTDFHNHAIKVFDLDGKLQSVIGHGIGEGPGQFNAATGLAIDNGDGGTLYAADWGNSRVQVFGPDGSFRSVVNGFSSPQPLFGPQGLAIDSQKMRLIVADSGNYCIKVFRSSSQTTCYI